MNREKGKPGAANAGAFDSGSSRQPNASKLARSSHRLNIRLLPRGRTIVVFGRQADTLALLIERGEQGFTSGEASRLGWARRTSDYVHRLRARGVTITTTPERSGDAIVGRYRLDCSLEILDTSEPMQDPEAAR